MSLFPIVIQGVLALAFLISGGTKLAGTKAVVANFQDNFRFPRWFVTLTGIVECTGAVGMAVGIWLPAVAFLAGGWLAITMLSAVATHIFRAHDAARKALPAFTLLQLSIAISLINAPTATHLLAAR